MITQPMIHGLNGSTLVALELAEYLKSQGAEVLVYTYVYDYPAKASYIDKNINVSVASDNHKLSLFNFDYIWVHSQVLPVSIIKELGQELPDNMPCFIFNHMSPFDWLADERPYIPDLEERLSSKSIFVSTETQDKQMLYFRNTENFSLFRNPAPTSFSELKYIPRKKLKDILIVSNHPPEELIKARNALNQLGIRVTLLGEGGEEYKLVTPEVISKHDAVITIGKTVQYCLVAGVPVYIYDRFGGVGYLNRLNYKLAASHNFSGRESKKQNAEYLVRDILDRYSDAVEYQTEYRTEFVNELTVDKVLPALLRTIRTRRINMFELEYMNAVISAQMFARLRFEAGGLLYEAERVNRTLQDKIEVLQRKLVDNKKIITNIIGSEAFRVGRMMMLPPSVLRKFASKINNRLRLKRFVIYIRRGFVGYRRH